jgi:hypothetical protein
VTPPVVVTQPTDVFDARAGSNVTFTVAAEGLNLTYLWQRADETLLNGDTRFVGVTTNTMTIQGIEFGDAGLYVCVISNGAGTVRSEGAMLTVSKCSQL